MCNMILPISYEPYDMGHIIWPYAWTNIWWITFKAEISKPAQRLFYAQHIHFQVFDDSWPDEKPVFINFIREPVSRFISHFYFRRFSSGKDTKEGYAFTGPRRTAELNINQCVDQGVKECTAVKIWKSGTVPYFCGEHDDCWDPCEEGFKRAIHNLDTFLFVGLTEEFSDSVKILEKMFPNYFDSLIHRKRCDSYKTLHLRNFLQH